MTTADPGIYNMDDQGAVIPKAVITVSVVVVAFIIGLIVAKLVDMCYERASIRDDASDISDYTKDLLKVQFMMAFNKKKKDGKETPEDIARRMVKLWRIGVVKKKRMRKIEAKKRAEAEKAEKAKNDKGKTNDKAKEKDKNSIKPIAAAKASVAPSKDPPAKVTFVNEKPKADTAKKPVAKETKEPESIPMGPLIVSSDPSEKPDVEIGAMSNGAKPSLTNRESKHMPELLTRSNSEDLMIPVSTDEDPKPLPVTSARRESGSSKSDYDFLRDPESESVRTVESGRGAAPDMATKTPSSLSAVNLESKDKGKDTARGTPTRPPRPDTSKTRVGPVSARPKSSGSAMITPTGRRVVSGKIVTPQGVKVVSRPKTPANTTAF